MKAKLKDFSKDKEIIAYCRGPFCVLADDAVRLLSEKGFNVWRLDNTEACSISTMVDCVELVAWADKTVTF